MDNEESDSILRVVELDVECTDFNMGIVVIDDDGSGTKSDFALAETPSR